MSPRALLLAFALPAAAACGASIHSVHYAPNPDRIAKPAPEAESLILANTVDGCVTEPSWSEKMLVVKFVCSGRLSGGIGNRVVRFDRIRAIVLQESGGWYRVLVEHDDHTPDFDWTSRNVEDMRRLADAFTALARVASAPSTQTPARAAAATQL